VEEQDDDDHETDETNLHISRLIKYKKKRVAVID